MRFLLNALILFFIFPIISFACSITTSDKATGGKCIDVNGYQLYVKVFGKRSPTVIFDSGSGDDSTVWDAFSPICSLSHNSACY